MDWAFHESQIRFDIRAEREEYDFLFNHQGESFAGSARAVRGRRQDRKVRHSRVEKSLPEKGGRTKAAASSKGPGLGQREEI
jgi:hypothetical protein